ncbi:MAG: DUF6056 family protein [Oscillospiraceae bacterium]
MQTVKMEKSFWKRLFSSPYLPFLVLWAILLACHLTFVMEAGDEVYYGNVLATTNLWSFSVYHYFNWSSRVLIELVLCVVAYLPKLVWRLMNPLVATVCALCLSKLAGAWKDTATNWLLCGFMLLYPWQNMRTAGWIATTLVYLWPAVAALAALLPSAAAAKGQASRRIWCALSLPLLLYATNMEQVAAFYVLLLAGVLVFLLAGRKKIHWVLWAQLGVCLAGIVYAITCPGAKVRYAVELSQWFPNYGMRSFVANLELGISTTLQTVLYARDYIFAFFCLLTAWLVWRRYKNVVYRLLALFPLGVCLVLGVYQNYSLRLFPQLAFFTGALNGEGMITLSNANVPVAYLPLLLLYAAFAASLVNLYLALGHTPTALAAVWVLVCGFGSRVMMGLSPTVWVSGDRTGLFFSLAVVAVCCVLLRRLKTAPRRQHVLFLTIFCAYCLLQIYSIAEM